MEANQSKRKRIVINLDQPGVGPVSSFGAGRKTRRWPKVVAILLVLIFACIVGLAVGGFFWWRHYQTTPAYSVALIVDAAQRDDMVAFGKQVDDDAVARNLVSEVSKKASDRCRASHAIARRDAPLVDVDGLRAIAASHRERPLECGAAVHVSADVDRLAGNRNSSLTPLQVSGGCVGTPRCA